MKEGVEIITDIGKDEILTALNVQGGDANRLSILWAIISSCDGNKKFEDQKDNIKNGVNIEFNIEKIIGGYVEEYPSSNRVRIKGYGKMSWDKYKDEIREREKLMRNMLRSFIDDNIDGQEEWNGK